MEDILNKFKLKAEARETDTTNKLGYNGYKGKIYKLGNMEFFDTYNYFRFGNPMAAPKFLNGTTRLQKSEFLTILNTIL